MKRIHLFSLANKGYSEKWLRSKDSLGYDLISVNAGIIYEFAKNNKEAFEYRILPVASENMMGDMSSGDFSDFREMIKESGWEVVKNSDPIIIKKRKGQEVPEIYENSDDERRVALAFFKRENNILWLSMFTIFISAFATSKGSFFASNDTSINIIELFFSYFALIGLIFTICSVLLNAKFIKLNEEGTQNNVEYFSSVNYAFIFNTIIAYLGVSIVYLILSVIARFNRFVGMEQFLLDSRIWVFGVVFILALLIRFIQPRVK